MPALSFSVFKEESASYIKRQSIRLRRKRPFKVNQPVYLFWKQRTKQCERLGNGICTEALDIVIDIRNRFIFYKGEKLRDAEVEDIARRDGFKTADEMFQFFKRYKKPVLEAQIIRWKSLKELWSC